MKVRLRFNPGGPGCDHIHVEDEAGNLLETLNGTLDLETVEEMGLTTLVGKRVAQAMKDWKRRNPTGQKASMKAAIEREDF